MKINRPIPRKDSQLYVGLQCGYIIVPSDVSRDSFIEQCYRWERVSILVERGAGVIHDCYITKNVLEKIEFPLVTEQLGSCVTFLVDPLSGHPVVFGILSKEDESQLLREGYFKINKVYNGSVVSISGDAKSGVLNLSVSGGTLSQLNISVTNTDKTAQINLRCRGDITLDLDGRLQLTADSVRINQGSEPMVLGGELKSQLEQNNTYLSDLVTAIEAALTIVDGMLPGTKLAFQTALVGKHPGSYTNINSTESSLD